MSRLENGLYENTTIHTLHRLVGPTGNASSSNLSTSIERGPGRSERLQLHHTTGGRVAVGAAAGGALCSINIDATAAETTDTGRTGGVAGGGCRALLNPSGTEHCRDARQLLLMRAKLPGLQADPPAACGVPGW